MVLMRVVAHGIDMVDCLRLEEAVEKHGERFLHRVFTQAERAYCLGKKRQTEHLAGRFAAKEAVLKVLGTGWRNGIRWTDVEVVNEVSGQPRVNLYEDCLRRAREMGIAQVLVSITHIQTHAVASAIGVGE